MDVENRPENWNTREKLMILSAWERWGDDWSLTFFLGFSFIVIKNLIISGIKF